ncbi:MAG: prolyl oligopeptidase family serine peptidase [Kofleriaceae bacterium]
MTQASRLLALVPFVTCSIAACGNPHNGASTDGGSSAADANADGIVGASPCDITEDTATCHAREVVEIAYNNTNRRVWWAAPPEQPPVGGWPAVVLYQGTNGGPSLTWDTAVDKSTLFGAYYQVDLVARLLDAGFAVIQPEADGGHFWYTNVSVDYNSSPDGAFIPALLTAVRDGTFGTIDNGRLFATGISSGGYMTSRMAVSYPGVFRALAIASGSYATCAGFACTVPSDLPADHPPTLFLHGEQDTIVPISTAHDYDAKLQANGTVTRFVTDDQAGHAWIEAAPSEILAWFTR